MAVLIFGARQFFVAESCPMHCRVFSIYDTVENQWFDLYAVVWGLRRLQELIIVTPFLREALQSLSLSGNTFGTCLQKEQNSKKQLKKETVVTLKLKCLRF